MPFPQFYAGQVVTPDDLMEMQPRWAIKTIDQTVSNSATPANDPDLYLDLPGNSRWYVRVVFMQQSITNGVVCDWDIPADASLASLKISWGPNATSTDGTNTTVRLRAHSFGTNVEYGSDGGASTWATSKEEAIVDLVSAGRIQWRWAQRISNAVGVIVRAGSFMRAERIS